MRRRLSMRRTFWRPTTETQISSIVAGCAGPGAPCKGALFQRAQVPPRQGSSWPGSYPSGGGGNEAVGAWETVAVKGRLQVGRPQHA